MKFNYNAHFEVSASEVKDLVFGLAKGFIKVQEWKAERDAEQKKLDHRMQSKKKFHTDLKKDMDSFNKRHQRNLKGIREFSDRIDKKIAYIESKCKQSDDIDVATLPEEIKRQIALDYIKKHPLSEDKQKKIADEYIRKYGVIK